jgi:RNA polymerase subunit RPABC4/transcription elongation factor Spt4
MELTCSRCHQAVQAGDCFCPVCGLPQLVYTDDGTAAAGQAELPAGAARDASTIEWKPALRSALALAIPAGILCAAFVRIGLIGLLLMPAAATWVIALYMRSQRPAWITIGAGARIGLVTGILGGWTTALTTGITLYAMRFWLHQGKVFDDMWQNQISVGSQQLAALGFDAQTVASTKIMMLSPEGRAASVLFNTGLLSLVILALAVAGGALGARLLGRPHRSQN